MKLGSQNLFTWYLHGHSILWISSKVNGMTDSRISRKEIYLYLHPSNNMEVNGTQNQLVSKIYIFYFFIFYTEEKNNHTDLKWHKGETMVIEM